MAFYVARVLLNDAEETLARQNEFRSYRRTLRDSNNPFELDNFNFKKLFRLPKDVVQMLIETLRPSLQRKRATGLAVEIQVSTILYKSSIGKYFFFKYYLFRYI